MTRWPQHATKLNATKSVVWGRNGGTWREQRQVGLFYRDCPTTVGDSHQSLPCQRPRAQYVRARNGPGNSEINTFYFVDSETDALPPREISAKDIVAWKALAKSSQSMQVEQISRPRNQHRTLYLSFQAFFAYTLKQWIPLHLLHSLILFDPRPSSRYAP